MLAYDPTLSGVSLSGTTDALADTLVNAIKGGAKGSEARADQTEFLGEVLGKAGAKFVALPEGKKALDQVTYTVAVPVALLAFAAGYWLATRKRRPA